MTTDQRKNLQNLAYAIYECIAASGPDGIPSGHLYARLIDKMPLDNYNVFISALVRTGKITNDGHLLKAINPANQ